MKAVKEDKLRRLATMKAARSFHRSLDAERTCELLRGISKTEEREGFVLCTLLILLPSITFDNPFHQLVSEVNTDILNLSRCPCPLVKLHVGSGAVRIGPTPFPGQRS